MSLRSRLRVGFCNLLFCKLGAEEADWYAIILYHGYIGLDTALSGKLQRDFTHHN